LVADYSESLVPSIFDLFYDIQQLFDYSENIFPELDTPLTGVMVDSLTLAILVLFFLAIVRIKELVKPQYVCSKYSNCGGLSYYSHI
jgi:hypothetical protein